MLNKQKSDKDLAKEAFDLFEEIKSSKKKVGSEFFRLGQCFLLIKKEKLYKYLDCDTFEEFIAQPELGYARPTVYLYMRIVDFLFNALGISQEAITDCEISKLQLILPVLERIITEQPIEFLDVCAEWLDRARHLSRHDLRNEIRSFYGIEEQEPRKKEIERPPCGGKYLDFVRNHPCILCGSQAEPHHFPKTKGAGADSWKAIPLCRGCHSSYQNNLEEFLLTYRNKIFDYFYEFIRQIFNV